MEPVPSAVRRLLCGASVALVLAAAACRTPVGVREVGFEEVYRSAREDVLDEHELSEGSRTILEYFGLAERYREAPGEAILELAAIADREGLRAFQVLLAEMHYDVALRDDDRGRFLAAAVHAWTYLFGEGFQDEPNPYARQFRLACDLYNRGLAQALRTPEGTVDVGDRVVETPIGRVALRCLRPGFPWDASEFSTFLPADAYAVRGLRERVRAQGLGMPLIAVQAGAGVSAMAAEHVGREVKLPVTAFLRLPSRVGTEGGTIDATLELYLGTDVPAVALGERRVPLETDLTAPLAHMLETSELWSFGLQGFLHGRSGSFEPGVFMLQPWQAEKIPVVLVHGTASSPAAWAQTINGLLLDPRLRTRYQVWLALYNTGNPIAYSAAQVRDDLRRLVETLDPAGDEDALSRMVLVGHSQGGLVCRLLVTSSGDGIWSLLSDVPFDDYPMKPEQRELMHRTLFFEPLPFVERAVFVATPHRGSYVAGGWIGRLARRLVSLPRNLVNSAEGMLVRSNLPPALRRIPTSVENMEPRSRFVRLMADLPFGGHVHLNSIIAVKPGRRSVEEGNDGVVEYASAHLDAAESELVVRHGHSCQGTPAVVGELRRILFEHLGESGGAPADAAPAD